MEVSHSGGEQTRLTYLKRKTIAAALRTELRTEAFRTGKTVNLRSLTAVTHPEYSSSKLYLVYYMGKI